MDSRSQVDRFFHLPRTSMTTMTIKPRTSGLWHFDQCLWVKIQTTLVFFPAKKFGSQPKTCGFKLWRRQRKVRSKDQFCSVLWTHLKHACIHDYIPLLLCCSPCLELYNMKWLILELNILIKLSFLNAVGLLGEFLVNSTSIGDFPSWPISQCGLPSQRLKTPNMPLLFFGKLWGCPTVRSWMKVVYTCL